MTSEQQRERHGVYHAILVPSARANGECFHTHFWYRFSRFVVARIENNSILLGTLQYCSDGNKLSMRARGLVTPYGCSRAQRIPTG